MILIKLNKTRAVTVGRTRLPTMLSTWIVAKNAQSFTTTCVLESVDVKTDLHICVDSAIRTVVQKSRNPQQAIPRIKSQQCDITFHINFISLNESGWPVKMLVVWKVQPIFAALWKLRQTFSHGMRFASWCRHSRVVLAVRDKSNLSLLKLNYMSRLSGCGEH